MFYHFQGGVASAIQVLTTSWLNGRKPRDLTASEKLRMVNLAALGSSAGAFYVGNGWVAGEMG